MMYFLITILFGVSFSSSIACIVYHLLSSYHDGAMIWLYIPECAGKFLDLWLHNSGLWQYGLWVVYWCCACDCGESNNTTSCGVKCYASISWIYLCAIRLLMLLPALCKRSIERWAVRFWMFYKSYNTLLAVCNNVMICLSIFQLCVPDWPFFNRNPVVWLDEIPDHPQPKSSKKWVMVNLSCSRI